MAGKVIVNSEQILKNPAIRNNQGLKNLAYTNSKRRFESEKAELFREFDNSPITKELNAGPNAENTSNTLSVSGPGANLFNYIGFYANSAPAAELRDYLQQNIKIAPQTQMKSTYSKGIISYSVPSYVPTLTEIKRETPTPDNWSGKSWVEGIEEGIPGILFYVYAAMSNAVFKTTKYFSNSRSGTGIQFKSKVRSSGQFFTRPYVLTFMREFTAKLRQK